MLDNEGRYMSDCIKHEWQLQHCIGYCYHNLTRAPLGYSAERAPLGGGILCPPCLTPERMVVERREKGQTKALNKTNLKNTKHFT